MDAWSLVAATLDSAVQANEVTGEVAPEAVGGGFDWGDAISGEVVTFAFGVLLAFVIPWLTVLITKRVERRANERSERLDAATALLRGASAYWTDVQAKRGEPGTHTFQPVEMELARARVLILTKSGRSRGEAALTDTLNLAGREMVSSRLGVLLGDWVPKGRFPVTNPLHHRAAMWSARQLQPSSRTPAPEDSVTPG